ISGAFLFFSLLALLYVLDLALSSPAGFAEAQTLLAAPLSKLGLLLLLAALTYHLVAGVKHMLLDFHIGDTVAAAKYESVAVFAVTGVIVLGLGVWLW
ncbi:MAG: succinate dehydrogenase, cytochrome b556 subunit, partial [Pseudomonadota bacterium]